MLRSLDAEASQAQGFRFSPFQPRFRVSRGPSPAAGERSWKFSCLFLKSSLLDGPMSVSLRLFNWLAGRRIAIVDDMSGVTRPGGCPGRRWGRPQSPIFELIDTGGVGMVDCDDLSDDVDRQIETAVTEADLLLFVVDIRDELMPLMKKCVGSVTSARPSSW